MTNCLKCKAKDAMRWNRDNSFYQRDGYWNCVYCGKVVFKTMGVPAEEYSYHMGRDERSNILMITPREVFDEK
jgi:Zn ribbon nucleic-acid-binding protein